MKKNYSFFIFLTYIPMFLLKFWAGELVGCGIKFYIQQVPTRHIFDRPRYPKNNKYLKKCDDDIIIKFFKVFIVFGVAGSIKSIQSGYSLDAEFNSASNKLSDRNLSKNTGIYVKNTNKKVVFFFSSSKINKYYFIILTIVLLIFLRRPILSWNFL